MPVVIPKPKPVPAPVAAPVASPAPPPAPSLTRKDVQDMLDARDAAWSRQLQAMADTFSAALKASQQTKSAAIGWDFDVDYAQGGQTIKSIRALPITKTPKD